MLAAKASNTAKVLVAHTSSPASTSSTATTTTTTQRGKGTVTQKVKGPLLPSSKSIKDFFSSSNPSQHHSSTLGSTTTLSIPPPNGTSVPISSSTSTPQTTSLGSFGDEEQEVESESVMSLVMKELLK